LNAVRTVQAFTHEELDRERFGARAEEAFAVARRRIGMRAVLTALVILLAFGAVAVVLWIGGRDVVAGRLTGGELSAFVFYAVLGPSGAGKTTVFQLLLRFYDPLSGIIRLDGVDLREADPAALRARIGLVAQDPVIFGADAFENIRYGRPGATDVEVRAAAEA